VNAQQTDLSIVRGPYAGARARLVRQDRTRLSVWVPTDGDFGGFVATVALKNVQLDIFTKGNRA